MRFFQQIGEEGAEAAAAEKKKEKPSGPRPYFQDLALYVRACCIHRSTPSAASSTFDRSVIGWWMDWSTDSPATY